MNVCLREARDADLAFLRSMLYEGVFWRADTNRPSLESGLALPQVKKELADWGARAGDTAVVATVESVPVGAAWYRFWSVEDSARGFVDEATPVMAIAVHPEHRRRGIGRKMIEWLIASAWENSVPQISLSVSKDNPALHLYRTLGFETHADRGDALTMVHRA